MTAVIRKAMMAAAISVNTMLRFSIAASLRGHHPPRIR